MCVYSYNTISKYPRDIGLVPVSSKRLRIQSTTTGLQTPVISGRLELWNEQGEEVIFPSNSKYGKLYGNPAIRR